MKLQPDNIFIPNENAAAPAERSGSPTMELLDSLLTSLYQPIVQAWLEKRLDAAISRNEPPHDSVEFRKALHLMQALLDAPAATEKLVEENLPVAFSGQMVWTKGLASTGCQHTEDAGNFCNSLYLRIWDTNRNDTSTLLSRVQKRLKKGGLLLLEVIRFSGFTAYPYHYSFSRTVELIASLETDKVMPEQWPAMLAQNGFGILDRANSSAAFLPHQHNRIISQSLEAFRSDILKHTNTAEAEIDALMPSLKQFEVQQGILICRPGVHLLLARKL